MLIQLEGMPAPQTREAAFVAPTAVITGDTILGKGTSVWFGAVVRGDGHPIRTGVNCNIQDNAVLHADAEYSVILGDCVSVGHASIVHGCTLEDSVLVGMNATILNGAHIGKGSLIAAGALVPEHMEVPPYSLVIGVPAKVKPLADHLKDIPEANWKEYTHLAALYAGGKVTE